MNQKGNILVILVFILVVIGLVVGVYLVTSDKLQIFKSRASVAPITPIGASVTQVGDGTWRTSDPTVEFVLNSSLAPGLGTSYELPKPTTTPTTKPAPVLTTMPTIAPTAVPRIIPTFTPTPTFTPAPASGCTATYELSRSAPYANTDVTITFPSISSPNLNCVALYQDGVQQSCWLVQPDNVLTCKANSGAASSSHVLQLKYGQDQIYINQNPRPECGQEVVCNHKSYQTGGPPRI